MLCCVLFGMLSPARGRTFAADHGLEKDVAPQAVADESDHHGIAIGHIGAAHALVQPRVELTGVPYRADALQTGVTQSGFDFAKELEHVLRAHDAARIGQRLHRRKLRQERREAACERVNAGRRGAGLVAQRLLRGAFVLLPQPPDIAVTLAQVEFQRRGARAGIARAPVTASEQGDARRADPCHPVSGLRIHSDLPLYIPYQALPVDVRASVTQPPSRGASPGRRRGCRGRTSRGTRRGRSPGRRTSSCRRETPGTSLAPAPSGLPSANSRNSSRRTSPRTTPTRSRSGCTFPNRLPPSHTRTPHWSGRSPCSCRCGTSSPPSPLPTDTRARAAPGTHAPTAPRSPAYTPPTSHTPGCRPTQRLSRHDPPSPSRGSAYCPSHGALSPPQTSSTAHSSPHTPRSSNPTALPGDVDVHSHSPRPRPIPSRTPRAAHAPATNRPSRLPPAGARLGNGRARSAAACRPASQSCFGLQALRS